MTTFVPLLPVVPAVLLLPVPAVLLLPLAPPLLPLPLLLLAVEEDLFLFCFFDLDLATAAAAEAAAEMIIGLPASEICTLGGGGDGAFVVFFGIIPLSLRYLSFSSCLFLFSTLFLGLTFLFTLTALFWTRTFHTINFF